jgi:hypothetical protein
MNFDREVLKGILPTLVMEVLAQRSMYGYELSRELPNLTLRTNGIKDFFLMYDFDAPWGYTSTGAKNTLQTYATNYLYITDTEELALKLPPELF